MNKTNDAKRRVMYPGKDKDLNVKALPLHNSIIYGEDSCYNKMLLRNVILRYVTETSPHDNQVLYWDFYKENHKDWLPKKNVYVDKNRMLPHFKHSEKFSNMSFLYAMNYIKEFIDTRKALRVKEDCAFGRVPAWICVLDNIAILTIEERIALEAVLADSEDADVYFILATNNRTLLDEDLVSLFPNRFVFKCDADTSRLLLDKTIAVTLPWSGVCYYKNDSYKTKLDELSIPFIPDKLLMKLVGAYSVRKENIE